MVTDANTLLRLLEARRLAIVFVCVNDLKHAIPVSHLPFLCRLTGTRLVALRQGSAAELHSYFDKKNLFMFALQPSPKVAVFCEQFPSIDRIDPSVLPQMKIN